MIARRAALFTSTVAVALAGIATPASAGTPGWERYENCVGTVLEAHFNHNANPEYWQFIEWLTIGHHMCDDLMPPRN